MQKKRKWQLNLFHLLPGANKLGSVVSSKGGRVCYVMHGCNKQKKKTELVTETKTQITKLLMWYFKMCIKNMLWRYGYSRLRTLNVRHTWLTFTQAPASLTPVNHEYNTCCLNSCSARRIWNLPLMLRSIDFYGAALVFGDHNSKTRLSRKQCSTVYFV